MPSISVSQLTEAIATTLGDGFPDVDVEGEVSGFKAHSSGHWYFTLKDERAALSCMMFRTENERMRRQPREGERLIAKGALSVYPARGTYALKVRGLTAVGAGDVAARLDALKRRLAAEGLFDKDRKRPLPRFPDAIGVATSPTGAAFQDILRVIDARFPGVVVYLAPCRVQGEGAAAEIADAVRLLGAHGKSKLLIVGRGGGSAEDLWAFNDEAVVRAVVASPIPTISAVGHEVDVTLCDHAADVRAATPSHAAELATPDGDALASWLGEQAERLRVAMDRRVSAGRDRVNRVRLLHPRDRVDRGRLRCDELDERLRGAVSRLHERRRDRLDARAQRLDALSPLRVLTRGYAIADVAGRVITDASTLAEGDSLRLRFARGEADATLVRVR